MGDVTWAAVDTPIGAMYVAANDAGIARIRLPGGSPPATLGAPVSDGLARACGQIGEYFDGTRTEFDLPIDWSRVSGFRRSVLETLYARVRLGSVVSYGDLAAQAGEPGAAREVGEIMATNPYPIVVPCHRVVASDGLGGYGGGLEMKRWLLAHEGVLPPMLDLWG